MRENLSRLKPSRYITPKVPMSETGTATPGISMVRKSRKKDENHEDDQADRNDQGALDSGNGGANVRRPIHDNVELDGLGIEFCNSGISA